MCAGILYTMLCEDVLMRSKIPDGSKRYLETLTEKDLFKCDVDKDLYEYTRGCGGRDTLRGMSSKIHYNGALQAHRHERASECNNTESFTIRCSVLPTTQACGAVS